MRILFAGTPNFAAAHLQALLGSGHEICAVLTQPDRPSGRGKKLKPSPVKAVATAAGLPVLQPVTLKDDALQTSLRDYQADVMVVVAYGLILPQAVLDIPRFGCLNVHASLLPRWRGAAPIQRAIEAGDPQSGVTIMQMEAGLDTGPMLAVRSMEIDDSMTGGELHDALADLGPEALLGVLSDLPAALAAAVPQNPEHATYANKINKQELALDWCQDAATLARKVRAFCPAPGCYSLLGGERIKIWAAEVSASTETTSPPGTVLTVDTNGAVIACTKDKLVLTNVQFSGGRRLPIGELVNGQPDKLRPGACFTQPDHQ